MDGVEELVEAALDYLIELVQRDPDAMVGHPRLGKVISADPLAAVAASDLRAAPECRGEI